MRATELGRGSFHPHQTSGTLRSSHSMVYSEVMASVVVVEDEDSLRALLQAYLDRAGFVVSGYADGRTALAHIAVHPPDLVLLDILLPELDGLSVLEEVRRIHPDVAVILLTALAKEPERLTGLSAGADDYITKPFSPAEVVLRAKAVLRRTKPTPTNPIIDAGAVRIDTQSRTAWVNGRQTVLTPSEYTVLVTLVRHPGQTFTRNQLLDILQGPEGEAFDRTVDVFVAKVRKKLGLWPSPIRTVYRLGYQWTSERP